MKSDDALAAETAVESRLAEVGADQIRGVSFADSAPTPGTPEPEVQGEDAPRNELGQFTSTTEPDPVAPDTVSSETPTGQDPAVQAFLSKYGGDVDKALAGAVHAQRKLGEQSSEVGELRRMVDTLSQLSETMTSQQQPQQPQMVLDQATVDWFDQQAMENPQQAVAWAQAQNNPLLVQRAMATWKEIDPYGAAVHTTTAQNQQLLQQVEQRIQQASQLPVDATVNLALQAVRSRNPEFANYDDAIEQTLGKHPYAAGVFKQAVASGDPSQIEGAIETLYQLSVGDTLRGIVLTGETPIQATTTNQVAVPTSSTEPGQAQEPVEVSPHDQLREQFRQEAERMKRGAFVAN